VSYRCFLITSYAHT